MEQHLTEEAAVWLRSCKLQGQREIAGVVLAAETALWEQAYPRLRITGGSGESTPPPPPCYFTPAPLERDPERNYLKTVGGSGSLWPALTKTWCFWGRGHTWRTGHPGVGATVRGS